MRILEIEYKNSTSDEFKATAIIYGYFLNRRLFMTQWWKKLKNVQAQVQRQKLLILQNKRSFFGNVFIIIIIS